MPSPPLDASRACLAGALLAASAVFAPGVLGAGPAGAEPGDAAEAAEKPSLFERMLDPDRRFVIVPVPQSNPTIGTGILLTAGYFHRQSAEDEAAGVPESSTQGAIGYFDTGAWGGIIQHQGFYKQDRWRVSGVAGYLDLRLDFFGVGGEAGDRNESTGWRLDGGVVWPHVLRRVRGDWFLGGDSRYIDTTSSFNARLDFGKGRLRQVRTEDFDVASMGLGARVEHDDRDNRFSTYTGTYHQLTAMFNDARLGSDNTYQLYEGRLRHYRPLNDTITLALEAKGRFAFDKIPFFDLSRLDLRGFSATRYMDNHAIQSQAEVRWRVFKRVGFVGFLGAGAVAPAIDDFDSSTVAWSYGGGIRFVVSEKRRVNLRADLAFTEDDQSLNLFVSEAF